MPAIFPGNLTTTFQCPAICTIYKIDLPISLQENLILAPELEHAPAPAIEFEIDTAPISETYKNGGNPVELAIPAIKVRICLDQMFDSFYLVMALEIFFGYIYLNLNYVVDSLV